MSYRLLLICLFALPILALAGPLTAQNPAPAVEPSMRHEIVDSVAALMERYYAVPDTGRMIAEYVHDQKRSGAYTDAQDLSALAEILSEDLRVINGDRHLSVRQDPTRALALSGSERDEEVAAARRAMDERARRNNYGFQRAEILEGNVGYLKFQGPVFGSPEAFDAAEQALRFLAHTDAVILDLRGVPGGSGSMMNFLISHFTEPNIPSLRIYVRPEDETIVRRTLSKVPGPRRTEVPLYVLVDHRSASAAEDLPFVLQNLERATIVGETTRGAGRNNRYYPVGHGLVASISVSRVQDPETGREWEQVGVVPDIQVTSDGALAVAHRHARERLARAEPPRMGDRRSRVTGRLRSTPGRPERPEVPLPASRRIRP